MSIVQHSIIYWYNVCCIPVHYCWVFCILVSLFPRWCSYCIMNSLGIFPSSTVYNYVLLYHQYQSVHRTAYRELNDIRSMSYLYIIRMWRTTLVWFRSSMTPFLLPSNPTDTKTTGFHELSLLLLPSSLIGWLLRVSLGAPPSSLIGCLWCVRPGLV